MPSALLLPRMQRLENTQKPTTTTKKEILQHKKQKHSAAKIGTHAHHFQKVGAEAKKLKNLEQSGKVAPPFRQSAALPKIFAHLAFFQALCPVSARPGPARLRAGSGCVPHTPQPVGAHWAKRLEWDAGVGTTPRAQSRCFRPRVGKHNASRRRLR